MKEIVDFDEFFEKQLDNDPDIVWTAVREMSKDFQIRFEILEQILYGAAEMMEQELGDDSEMIEKWWAFNEAHAWHGKMMGEALFCLGAELMYQECRKDFADMISESIKKVYGDAREGGVMNG